jgi:hypothetical protein
MKTFILLLFLSLLYNPIQKPEPKRRCNGYTKIEFGKAVDCNGDTLAIKELSIFHKEHKLF